jgi:hypothetical protein
MGLISRILGLGKGKLNRAVADAEAKDVDAVYRNALNIERQRAQEMNDLRRETMGLVFQVQEKIEGFQKELKQLEQDLEAAKGMHDIVLGPTIIEKMDTVNAELTNAREEQACLEKEVQEISKVTDSQALIVERLEKEWKSATSTLKADEVLKKIEERKNGLATDASSEALRNVQNKVTNARAGRKASLAIEEQSLDNRLAALRSKSSQASSASRFEEMLKK